MIISRASLWTLRQKFLRPLKAFPCILCTYTRTRSRSITSPHPYLVPSWNDPRVARKFDKLCLQMFILTRSTKRDVASTSIPSPPPLFSSFRHNEIHVLVKYEVDPSCFPKKFRGFVVSFSRLDVSSNLTFAFSSWMFPMRFVLIVLPLKQFSCRIRIGTPFLL